MNESTTTSFSPDGQQRLIASRYEGLQFAPLTRMPDTSRNRQRVARRTSKRRTIR